MYFVIMQISMFSSNFCPPVFSICVDFAFSDYCCGGLTVVFLFPSFILQLLAGILSPFLKHFKHFIFMVLGLLFEEVYSNTLVGILLKGGAILSPPFIYSLNSFSTSV